MLADRHMQRNLKRFSQETALLSGGRRDCPWTFRPAVVVLVVTGMFIGCGTKVPASSSAKVANAEDLATVAQETGTGTVDPGPSASNSSHDANPVTPAGEQQGEESQSASKDKGAKAKSSTLAQTPASGEPKKSTVAAKVPAAPTAEQISKWAIPTFSPLRLIACQDGFGDGFVHSAAISPDGKRFVLGGVKLTVWNMVDSAPSVDLLAEIKGTEIERPIRAVAISPDGNWLAAGDQKGFLRIWNFADLKENVKVRAHDARLLQLAFSPNSQTLATTSYSGEVRFWQVSDGKKLGSGKVSDHELARMAFLSETQLVGVGRETSIWNVEQNSNEKVLTTAYITAPALGLSADRKQIAFGDQDAKVQFWDLATSSLTERPLLGAAAHLIDISHDGKLIATASRDSTIRIWDAATGQPVQVIDADGGRTTGLQWIPNSHALFISSEIGRVRIWGTDEQATSLGLTALLQPVPQSNPVSPRKPFSSAQLQRVIDIRSFPKLPGAVPQWGDVGILGYSVSASTEEAEQFYRFALGNAGWKEMPQANNATPGLAFQKDGCQLSVMFTPGTGDDKQLQVNLQLLGNFDVRQVPSFKPAPSQSTYSSFSSVMYRTKAELLELEVGLLKLLHTAGWTPYSRLAASSQEDPEGRMMSFIQEGSKLTVFIARPADAQDEFSVQVSTQITNKSLPVPPDAGWIEFDNSTDLQLVANTKMDLKQTAEFYDKEMAADEWVARESGRGFKDEFGFLPYIRGQQDVLIRLVGQSDGSTRIIVGEAERSSWQLQKSNQAEGAEKAGLEAADVPLPKSAAVKYEVDQKQVLFEISDVTPPDLAEQFASSLGPLGWKREKGGVVSDDYVLATFNKSKAEVQLRIRMNGKKTSAMVSGDGLLWAKPLPAGPVRISYGTWLRREKKKATLDRLEEYTAEMKMIPLKAPAEK